MKCIYLRENIATRNKNTNKTHTNNNNKIQTEMKKIIQKIGSENILGVKDG